MRNYWIGLHRLEIDELENHYVNSYVNGYAKSQAFPTIISGIL